MPALRELQQAYLQYCESGNLPEELSSSIDPSGISQQVRIDIYQHTTFVTLKNVLENAYPKTAALLGEELFQNCAGAFINSNIPQVSLLDNWGDSFPEFIGDIGQSHAIPYLQDVAQLEWLLHIAYLAPDYKPLDGAELAQYSPEQLVEQTFTLCPAIQLFQSDYDVKSIIADEEPTVRKAYAVITRVLAPELHWVKADEHKALEMLNSGSSLAKIPQQLPNLDIQNFLIFLLKNGALKSNMAEKS